jgi:hypothetical protein
MRRIAFVLVVVAALVAVPAAAAKGPIQICGAHACVTIAAETAAPQFVGVGANVRRLPPPPVAPYYVIRFAAVGGPLSYWIPSVRTLRLVGGSVAAWARPSAETADLLTRTTATMAPKPTPTLPSYVTVAGKLVRDRRGWLRLYSVGTPVTGESPPGGWLPIHMSSYPETPWTDGTDSLAVSRRGSLLRRDGELVRIPAAIARLVRARAPLL